MIIVNQNEDEFVNFDNIMCVNVTNCEEDGWLISAGFIVGRDDNYRELGYYKTEERAKEILLQIVKWQNILRKNSVLAMADKGFTFPQKYYFEMPKE